MGRFCQSYLFVHSWESTNSARSRSDLQNLPIFNWSPQRWSVTSNHIFKEKKIEKCGKKTKYELNGKGWSWRSWRIRAGQQARILERCRRKCVGRVGIWIHDGVRHNSIHGSWKHACPRMSSAWSSRWWWKDDGYVPGQVTYDDQKYRTCVRLYFEGQVL